MEGTVLNKEAFKHKYIIFGHEHHNSLGQVRSLGEYGIRPICVILRGGPKSTSKSRYVSEKYYVDSVEEGYRLILNKWGRESYKPFIFTSDDIITSYLDLRYDELKDHFIFNNCGEQGRITYLMDKAKMNDIALSLGVSVPWTIKIDENFQPDGIQFPVLVKTINSLFENWKDDSFICHNKEEFLERLKKIDKNKEFVVQQYIEKKNELCLEGYSYNKGKENFIALGINYKYFLDGAYSHYLNCFNIDDTNIANIVDRLMKQFRYEGVFEVEFIEDKSGKLYFLESNFRNSAWGYATSVAGMSTAIGWINSQLEGEKHSPKQIRVKDGFTAISEFSDFRIRVLGKQIKYKEWKKQLKNADCKYYYNKKDKRPFRSALFYKLFIHRH